MKRPQLAKLTRPRLHKAVARERLFALLDEAREHKPVICVVGPPGAGKTTLVASWLDARNIKGIWFQVDPGDSDLATFFYYLGEAAKTFSRKRQRPLPRLTPEYLHDIDGFSRRFFRELFSRLPHGAMLVLDNYQEVQPAQRFHNLIATAVEEVPTGVTLIVVSRSDTPESYARLIANEKAGFIDWEALKLTISEVSSIAGPRAKLIEDGTRLLHQQCEGWAAGLVLVLEGLREGVDTTGIAMPDAPKSVFDYFAGQLFDQLDPATQDLLLRVSYLPKMTVSSVAALTGSALAGGLLENYYRRHLFIDRRGAREPVYQFHALFRAFLQERAELTLGTDEIHRTAKTAARVLDEQGFPDDAFQLYLRADEQAGAISTILREAERIIAQGRWRTVVEWVNALPEDLVHSDCWLTYWLGIAQASVTPAIARPVLIAGYELAVRDDDILCQIQVVAGIIQTFMLEYASFRPMDPWIDILKMALAKVSVFPSEQGELRARSALMISLSFRKPGDPALAESADRVFELVQGSADSNLRALGAAYLVAYGARTGPLSIARKAAPLLQEMLADPTLSALTAGWGLWILAFFHLITGDDDACRRAVAEEDRIGREESLYAVSRFAAVTGAHLEMDAGNLEVAQAWSDRLEQVAVPGLAYDHALSNTIKAFLAVLRGDPAKASRLAEEAIVLFDKAGVHHLRCVTRSQLAWALLLQGKLAEAGKVADEALRLALTARAEWVELDARMIVAAVALESSRRNVCEENLRVVFELAQQTPYVQAFRKYPLWAERLCAEALELGVPVAQVRKLVRQFGLSAPLPSPETWPWLVRVFVLGQFRVLIDDEPLTFSRKTPKKPIAVLKALIAFGGHDVALERIVDAVWPDEEGDSAHDACWLSLHRLRKLLGASESVLLTDARISLNPKLVWTDVGAFEHALAQTNETPGADELERVLSLYKGDFLPGEPGAPWAAPTRERLRGKFIHQLERHGRLLEEMNRWDGAVSWYLRGIDADPIAEAFYQGLMRCHQAQGRAAEGLSAYRRLRQTLSITLGVAPSPSTEAVARELRLHT
jgi:LuxR family maltose regulon positive regulatory protein